MTEKTMQRTSTSDKPDWMAREDAFLLPTYAKYPISIERGEGSWVWDSDGNRYLDLWGGHAVALLGHAPEPVVRAIQAQAARLLFYSNVAYSQVRASAAAQLVELCGMPGARVFFCNSGAEANENAMRVARLATGRAKIVATRGAFHGRTAGALAATGIEHYTHDRRGMGGDVQHVPFNDAEAADAAIDHDTAGVLVEPIQSMAGVIEPEPGYLQALEHLCRARGALLLFDEVQTGLGRVGAPTAAQAYGVHADVLSFAKGIGSGVPCGAIVVGAATGAHVRNGDLGSTFGGGPLACAAVDATLDVIRSWSLWTRATEIEQQIRSTFRHPALVGIRGRGLLLGLVLSRPARPVRDALLERRILVGTAEDPHVLRILPPLTLEASEVDVFRHALEEVL